MNADDGYSNYFRHFEGREKGVLTLENFFEVVSQHPEKFTELATRLKDPKPLKILVLGSAAPANLKFLSDFLHNSRNENPGDEISLLDKTESALRKHADSEFINMSPKPRLIGGDMNSLPMLKNSEGLVIADFTLNLVQDFSFVGLSVKNISQVLKNEGLFLGSVVTSLESQSISGPESHNYLGQPFARTYFPFNRLRDLATNLDLYPRGDVTVKPNPKSNIAVTYFIMQKVEKPPAETFTYRE